jgi:hypothetical protein
VIAAVWFARPVASRSEVASIRVAQSCPKNTRFLTFAQLRARNADFSGYSDAELAEALVQICYPSERPEELARRLDAFQRVLPTGDK